MAKIALQSNAKFFWNFSMTQVIKKGLARRVDQNPLLRPTDIKSSSPSMKIECLLNPGVFEFENRIWMLVRVAERPDQHADKVSFPLYNGKGQVEILSFDKSDP